MHTKLHAYKNINMNTDTFKKHTEYKEIHRHICIYKETYI